MASNNLDLILQRIHQLDEDASSKGPDDKTIASHAKQEFAALKAKLEGLEIAEAQKVLLEAHHQLIVRSKRAEIDAASEKKKKTTLEDLCRELQKQNKALKAEMEKVLASEAEKRKALIENFETSIADVSKRIEEDHKAKVETARQTEDMRAKFQNYLTQQEAKDEHLKKLMEAKELELQLSQAKMKQFEEISFECMAKLDEVTKKCHMHMTNEATLEKQLAIYSEKFKDLQETIVKSNEVFDAFKKQSALSDKTIKKLEKDRDTIKEEFQKAQGKVLALTTAQIDLSKECQMQRAKIETLERLCRALQAQRADLEAKLASVSGKSDEDLPELVK